MQLKRRIRTWKDKTKPIMIAQNSYLELLQERKTIFLPKKRIMDFGCWNDREVFVNTMKSLLLLFPYEPQSNHWQNRAQ